ncbi:MAG: aldehyde dehydrogenase family protein [Patescibacteria group bacterium]|nr:aldehyde dehydrogenase family protein [Patescibacteria group bacterium]
MMTQLISTNPSKNYQPVGSVIISTEKEIKEKVRRARLALENWKEIGINNRVKILTKALAEFKKHQEVIAQLITKEMGMTISASRDEIGWDFD